MKKWLFFVCLLSLGVTAYADEGRGSCRINGTEDAYVEVTAYSNGGGTGNFVISNASSKPLMSVYITITAEVSNYSNSGYQSKTLYKGNYTTKVDAYSSGTADFTYAEKYIRNISVSISNPTCTTN